MNGTFPDLPLCMEDDENECWLMYDLSRKIGRLVDRRAQQLGLTRAQWKALCAIRRNEGIRQTDLADNLEVEPMTLARLLDRLQAAGWIERRDDPTDRRAKRIFLTGDVLPTIDEVKTIILGVRQEVLAGLSEAERQTLVATLKRVKSNAISLL